MLRGRIPLILATIFAILAALVAYLAVDQASRSIAEGWQPVRVLIAARDMKAGTELSPSNLSYESVPARIVTRSVITKSMRDQGEDPVGQKLAIAMTEGDILTLQHIDTRLLGQRLARAVQNKGRAVSIRVSSESSVHHWIAPSDRVDVVGIFRDPRSREMTAVTMLQNVIVLATGRIGGQTNRKRLTENELSYSTVTLHVLPEAAEMLVLAQELGSLYLTLRNPDDNEILDLTEGRTTMTTLLTGERSRRLSTRQNKIFRVEIIRAGKTEQQVVP